LSPWAIPKNPLVDPDARASQQSRFGLLEETVLPGNRDL
jgi:hypothetical protein